MSCPGSISFVTQDAEIWLDVEGAVEWIQSFLFDNELQPPAQEDEEDSKEDVDEEVPQLVEVTHSDAVDSSTPTSEANVSEAMDEGDEDFDETFDSLPESEKHKMYLGMFYTGLEMASDDTEDLKNK